MPDGCATSECVQSPGLGPRLSLQILRPTMNQHEPNICVAKHKSMQSARDMTNNTNNLGKREHHLCRKRPLRIADCRNVLVDRRSDFILGQQLPIIQILSASLYQKMCERKEIQIKKKENTGQWTWIPIVMAAHGIPQHAIRHPLETTNDWSMAGHLDTQK